MLSAAGPALALGAEVVAHAGEPVRPHDLAGAWDLDPLVIAGLAALAWAHRAGSRPGDRGRGRRAAFGGALAVLALALLSPLDALAGALASAHMVQHVLLVLAAAPLLAASAPAPALVRGSPRWVRTGARALRRAVDHRGRRTRLLRSPGGRWLAFVATLWLWHTSVLYGAAVEHEAVHVLEHATFVGTAVLVWSSILGPARARMERGLAVLAVFTLGLQGVLLSALITFARAPWYEPYLDSTSTWGLSPLADQQLAGVIMWVPAGLLHAAIGLWLLTRWLAESEAVVSPAAPGPATLGR